MPPAPPVHWPSFLRQIYAIEQSWNAHKVTYPRDDAVHFLPFPIPQFVSMLTDAVMVAPTHWAGAISEHRTGPRQTTFLDVGCGPGTKMQLAKALFGLDVYGIDIVPAFVAEAQASGLAADLADAFEFNGYGAYDILLVNRPSTLQPQLEKIITEGVAPGCVLMCANWRDVPPGFEIVAIEYEKPVCGVFRKPA